jgi:uncharacterized cofD-like protein
MPNMLVPDVARAIRASRAFKVFVCNVATQPGETAGYSCGDHVRALEDHVGGSLFDLVVANQQCDGELPVDIQWVTAEDEMDDDYAVYRGNLLDDEQPWRHDAGKLAHVLMDLLEERTGPLVE